MAHRGRRGYCAGVASGARVVVVGAGIVGAACAYYLHRAGAQVTVLDAGPIAGGASSAGQGNLQVSSRAPGPALELAKRSRERWDEIASAAGGEEVGLDARGGLVVAADPDGYARLAGRVAAHRAAGLEVTEVSTAELPGYEPHLAGGLAGGAYYPGDAQIQPVAATAHLLAGVEVRCGQRVRAVETDGAKRVTGVRVDNGPRPGGPAGRGRSGWGSTVVSADAVVNAAGVAGGELAATVGTRLPVTPRRGFILVTEPLWNAREAPPIRRTVYAAEYPERVASDASGLVSAAVVAPSRAGTVLIGSSRESVGLDSAYPSAVLRRLAAQAVALFPFLARVRVVRAYHGFRPFLPDHLPVIGPDPRVSGLWHACGHEGAGVTMAPATGALIAAQICGADPGLDPAPFSPARFA